MNSCNSLKERTLTIDLMMQEANYKASRNSEQVHLRGGLGPDTYAWPCLWMLRVSKHWILSPLMCEVCRARLTRDIRSFQLPVQEKHLG